MIDCLRVTRLAGDRCFENGFVFRCLEWEIRCNHNPSAERRDNAILDVTQAEGEPEVEPISLAE